MLAKGALVVYKNRPARVLQVGDKLTLEVSDGGQARVRPKDVQLLHPGPLENLDQLEAPEGEVRTAWEILTETIAPGETVDLRTLAELAFGEFTPASAWAAWELLDDGLYFHGDPQAIAIHLPEDVARLQKLRQARQQEVRARQRFLERLRRGTYDIEEDGPFLRELEDLALERRPDSPILRQLGRAERPEVAHALLLDLGAWDPTVNPYPIRLALPRLPPDLPLDELPEEPRRDLTHLASYAIDDPDNQDPDDALSLEGDRLWIHVADAAALITPDSPADLEARGRGATLYLPEGAVPMLPSQAIATFGLGLQEISPALSFGVTLADQGEIEAVEVVRSWVKVQRTTYEQVEDHLDEEPFVSMLRLAMRYHDRRLTHGALAIDLPEVIVRVRDGDVDIRPVLPLRSRDLVREAMLMAGEAAARYALQHDLPFPFVIQDSPHQDRLDQVSLSLEPGQVDLAAFHTMRRFLKRSEVRTHPVPHAGVGLPAYSRVTSPLRRYLDLVAHQQLRAHLRGLPPLDESQLLERVGASEAITGSVNRAESLSRRHWTLVYLLQNPAWQGEGILVEKRATNARLVIPALALYTSVHLPGDFPLNTVFEVRLKDVNLPALEAYFEVLGERKDR